MNALIEKEKGGCGMFGLELPLIFAGIILFNRRKKLL